MHGKRPRTPDALKPARKDGALEKPGVNADESPLSWLHRRKDKEGQPLISREAFEAGERLRADFHVAQLSTRVTASWSGVVAERSSRRATPGLASELQDHVVAARERVNRALHTVGPEQAGILIDVCCYLKGLESLEKAAGWPQRSGKVILQLALQRLARHYGIVHEGSVAEARRPARVRHWGTGDYRPRADGDG